MRLTRREFVISTAAIAGTSLISGHTWAFDAEDDQAWNEIRAFLFKDRPIKDANGLVRLDVPIRPPNGGDVTVNVLSSHEQSAEDFIAGHYLVVDKNPSPVAAQFTLSPHITADVSTRLRVNEYSNMRVIAETNKGVLYMDKAVVKASGGCSAPPMGDDAMAKLMMGKTRLTGTKPATPGAPHRFHLAVTHPSYSGLQKDQITTYFIPAHYIEVVEVKNKAGDIIFAVKGDISFSENPSFDFSYVPMAEDDVLSVKILDSRKKVFETQWPVAQI